MKGTNENLSTDLKLSGFINIRNLDDEIICEKPNYEVGSSAKLSFAKKTDKSKIASVWKIDNDDVDEDIIDADNLLDEEDKVKPDPSSLKGYTQFD